MARSHALLKFLFLGMFISIAHAENQLILKAVEQTLVVHGKPTKVFNIIQPDGTEGYTGIKGTWFNVKLKNETSVPISIHWHGMVLPNDQDGVAFVTQLPIPPGGSHDYRYQLVQSGTYWMHSHYKFHEQQLMTAPMIIKDQNDPRKNEKEVTVMFQDFSFKNPETIFADLQHGSMGDMHHDMEGMHHEMSMTKKPDLNDVQYDAFLANRHTLQDPQVFKVSAGEKVRLRLINGSAASNFWIDTGKLEGMAIAVDGNDIQPIRHHLFQLPVAERIDVEVTIPQRGGAFPILAQVEGTNKQAGVMLVTEGTILPKLSEIAAKVVPALNDAQERQTHPLHPLVEKLVDAVLNYKLTGDMQNYVWKINNEVWPRVKPQMIHNNKRIAMVFTNDTDMAHPMHLHGHVFQLVEVNGKPIKNGPLHDTILVLPHSSKKIIFDANNPGIWMMHCHVLYHMHAGMMTTTNYVGYNAPKYYEDLINGKISDH